MTDKGLGLGRSAVGGEGCAGGREEERGRRAGREHRPCQPPAGSCVLPRWCRPAAAPPLPLPGEAVRGLPVEAVRHSPSCICCVSSAF